MQTELSPTWLRIPPEEMNVIFFEVLLRCGFSHKDADTCSRVFTESSIDGVYTHGVNRFPRFVQYVRDGYVKPQTRAVRKNSAGNIEQWDGQSGAGPVNALICTDRALEIASEQGLGCVALANTNHWLRGGTYGWRAAKAGFVFIGWTNTIANMPAWGAVDSKLGNNPMVIGIPYRSEAIVLDMAMSQYSYGAMELYAMKNEKLPVPGGYTEDGRLTDDPTAIQQSKRTLPVGYWKGAGLSLLLDILAAALSGGLSTAAITAQRTEYNLSQVFIALDLSKLQNFKSIPVLIDNIIDDYHRSRTESGYKKIQYPGERVLLTRKENSAMGIPVLRTVWDEILTL
ncbi:MAG: 3-dehydro-L-gulonate 2-dehydrogenase [Bacteroidota bacterium]